MPQDYSNESPLIYSLEDEEIDAKGGQEPTGASDRRDLIEGLRNHIRRIEGSSEFAVATLPGWSGWTLGMAAIDEQLGPQGLEPGGLHEIRSEALEAGMDAAAATAARRTFALLLAVRRLRSLERPGPLLWCLPMAAAYETGMPYARGLASLGLDPDRVVIVTPGKSADVLWVVEEAVKAGCLSLVLGEVAAVGVTAARRLSLAAAEARTPCLLVSSAGKPVITAAASRWRVTPRPSGEHPLDPAAPGERGFALALERCRARPVVSGALDFAVEWSDAARCFRMAAAVSDRAPAPGLVVGKAPESEERWRRTA